MKICRRENSLSSSSSSSTSFRKMIFGCSFLALSSISIVESFTIPSHQQQQHYRQRQNQQQQPRETISTILTTATKSTTSTSTMSSSSSSSSSLSMAAISSSPRVEISTPSQSKCETLGIREWPQQSKKGSWTECTSTSDDDEDSTSLVRYVLEGTGTLKINDNSSDSNNIDKIIIKPGTLVEIGGNNVELEWTCDDDCQNIIVLTPTFEEGNIFIGVIGGIIILFGLLLSGIVG